MIKNDFRIGLEFYTGSGKWCCTDVGTRIIVAIKLDKEDASWYKGPPYAVAEQVFDENEMEGCSPDTEALKVNGAKKCKKGRRQEG
jgi:hypothetical protein